MTGIAKFVLAVGRLLFAGSDAARPKDGRLSLQLINRGAEVFGRRLLTAALANLRVASFERLLDDRSRRATRGAFDFAAVTPGTIPQYL